MVSAPRPACAASACVQEHQAGSGSGQAPLPAGFKRQRVSFAGGDDSEASEQLHQVGHVTECGLPRPGGRNSVHGTCAFTGGLFEAAQQ